MFEEICYNWIGRKNTVQVNTANENIEILQSHAVGAQHVQHAFSLVAVIVAVIRDDDIKGDFHNDDVALIITSTRWTNG